MQKRYSILVGLLMSLLVGLIIALSSVEVLAHGDESHARDSVSTMPQIETNAIHYFVGLWDDLSSYHEFPTLHPLIVHVPVVLIPLALIFAIFAVFSKQALLLRISLATLALGTLGGFIAAFPLHPHTTNLPEAAVVTLGKHDFFAYTTLWLGSAGVLLGILHCYTFSRLTKGLYIMLLVLVTSCVAITGHYGGKLTYIHGIGVQGNHLQDRNRH